MKLQSHIDLIGGLLNASSTPEMFEEIFFRACVNPDQLSMQFNTKQLTAETAR